MKRLILVIAALALCGCTIEKQTPAVQKEERKAMDAGASELKNSGVIDDTQTL